MNCYTRLSIKGKLTLLNALFIVGLTVFGMIAYGTMRITKVNGPIYSKVIEGKDLIADILLPPEHIIESYLVSFQIAEETDSERLKTLIDRTLALKKEYDSRHAYWLKTLGSGRLREAMLVDAYQPAVEFFRVQQEQLIPAALNGEREKAIALVAGALRGLYEAHRKYIDEVVQLATQQNAVMEANANSIILTRSLLLAAIGLLTVSVVASIGLGMARRIGGVIERTVASMEAATCGDYSQKVSTNQGGELGRMAAALGKMLDEIGLRALNDIGRIKAISKIQAIVELDLDGTIRSVNENFTAMMGYSLDEIGGKHHRMLVDEEFGNSPEYHDYWVQLRRGEYVTGEFKWIGKGGKEIWVQASYNPIFSLDGKPCGVVQYATDITKQKLCNADLAGRIAAIDKAQAVISFEMDGTIQSANNNFLKLMGYSLPEIRGKPHEMFVDNEAARSSSYQQLWNSLRRGEPVSGEFKQIGKGGREIWIQASYNPILDLNDKPYKVVKYAADITEQVMLRNKMAQVIGSVSRNAQALSRASEELAAVSQQMSASAEETSMQASTVSTASADVSSNVQTVAVGTEEMSASIREIAKNAADAARVAISAVAMAANANTTVTQLGDSSGEIGKVIKVITSIAHQTKLLALNATIEAARAGEAGKGFAVVANEVKELAKETAKATEDISQKIEAIQSDTGKAVAAIAEISNIINQINDIQSTIASAVEEQTATTNEMSRNLVETARGSSEIVNNIVGVAKAAQDTSVGASKSLQATQALSQMASELQQLVSEFNGSRNEPVALRRAA